jgi:hypothetical protein
MRRPATHPASAAAYVKRLWRDGGELKMALKISCSRRKTARAERVAQLSVTWPGRDFYLEMCLRRYRPASTAW